jgi:hypothetical protein
MHPATGFSALKIGAAAGAGAGVALACGRFLHDRRERRKAFLSLLFAAGRAGRSGGVGAGDQNFVKMTAFWTLIFKYRHLIVPVEGVFPFSWLPQVAVNEQVSQT